MPSQPNGYSRENVAQHAGRNARAADAVEPVAACDHVALELVRLAFVAVPDSRAIGVEIVQLDVVDLEEERCAVAEPGLDQILDDLGLAVDDDRCGRR